MIKQFFRRNEKSKYDVILHIGAPKTGSSAIQKFCILNRKQLLESGFYYPKHFLDINGISGGHSQISGPLLKDDFQQASHTVQLYLKRAKKLNACLLLSAEGFYNQFESMQKSLEGFNVLVVAWFRHPLEAFASNYVQSVKRHSNKKNLLDFCATKPYEKQKQYLGGDYLLRWADSFQTSHCHFLSYGSWKSKGFECLEEEWLSVIGMEKRSFNQFVFEKRTVNGSYLPEALELKRLFNYIVESEDTYLSDNLDWTLQQYSDENDHQRRGVASLVPDRYASEIIDFFKQSNELLLSRFSTMDDFESTEVVSDSPLDQEPGLGLDVRKPLAYIREQKPELIRLLHKKLCLRLGDNAPASYPIMKLADLFGLDFSEPPSTRDILPESRKNVLTGDKAQLPDFLRETALMMEQVGDFETAIQLIDRAHLLRPKGLRIIKIQERLYKNRPDIK